VLTREELRRRVVRTPDAPHLGPGGSEGWLHGDDPARDVVLATVPRRTPAAVLIGIVDRPQEPAVLLTQRTDHLRDHAGQISFPGGRIEPGDATTAAAALREAEEEVGLDAARVEILGELAPYDTVTGFRIHPVVGWITPPFELRLDQYEVADAFEVPLHFVVDPLNHRRHSLRRGGLTRGYYVLPYQGRFIWGATAGILVNFASLLRA
jgi:8-oxo-dGTP pyrophosphatase MutT (NUDIX family)